MAALLSYALTSVSDVKESLGIASSDTSKDNLIIRKINQATRAIEAYCGRRFLQTTYTQEIYNGTNIDQIILKQRPVSAVTLQARDTTLNDNDFETIESTLYFVESEAGILDLVFGAVGRWGAYAVTYTAGYATIPEDLAEACASLACFYVNNADGSDIGVSRKQEGSRSIQYANGDQSFKSIANQLGINEIIDSYANMPVQTDR